jgi:Zn-finger nucleic acid-binding protein
VPRCGTCTAPLPSHTGLCAYCGSHNDVDLKGIHEFTLSRPESPRICPDCDIPLQTIDLHVEGKFYIERCDTCLGLFFDSGELEALMDKSVSNVFSIDRMRIQALVGEQHDADNRVVYRKCPVCRQLMNRMNFGHRSGVVVDQCRTHGIWLDSGELRRLLDWKKAGGQLLHEEVKARREEERKREERSHPYPEASSFDDLDGSGFPPRSDSEIDLIDTLARILGKLFK